MGEISVSKYYQVPTVNFEAEHISELSDLASSKTEAPITNSLSNSELRSIAFRPLDMKGFPCHTTACERGVQVPHLYS